MNPLSVRDLEHIWERASRCLPLLTKSRIFITGGTGFFGSWILESVDYANRHFDSQIEVTVLTRDKEKFLSSRPHLVKAKWLDFLVGDILDVQFPKILFTHVIHAATEASARLNQENPLLMLDTNIVGTRRVLEFCVKTQAKYFLLTSSGAVYGPQPRDLSHISESYQGTANPLSVKSAYAIGKMAAEHLCLLFAKQYGFSVKIARCFAFVGPYLPLDIHFAIGNFMGNALAKKPIQIAGDGTPYRSYLYAADLMIWLWTILCYGRSGEAYNVGSEQGITIADLAELIANQVVPTLPVIIEKSKIRTELPERYVPSTQKAQNELQLKSWINLAESIQRTLQWWGEIHAKTQ